ncbi:MAG: ComF family protein [Anaerosomatales bacterium]
MVWSSLLELLLPTRCAGCDLPGDLLCEECRQALPLIEREWACPRCGAPFGYLVCTECWKAEPAFEAGVCVGSLAAPLSRCISLYKDAGERRLGVLLGDMLGATAGVWREWPQAVVPIPPSETALRRRGFDHTGVIGSRVATALGVPLMHALASTGARDQRVLGRTERRLNVEDAFVATGGDPLPPRVLLVDDVMTTGATLDAASAVLLAAGAEVVRVGTIARAW